MPSPSKDILEFPLEEIEVPQAIVLMMQAATTTKNVTHVDILEDGSARPHIMTDNDRLQLLCEKLEQRVEDELEKGKAVRTEPVEEDAPNEPTYTGVDGHAVTLVKMHRPESGQEEIMQVVVDGVTFGLLCNERVGTYEQKNSDALYTSTCIKQFGHMIPEHEDEMGNTR